MSRPPKPPPPQPPKPPPPPPPPLPAAKPRTLEEVRAANAHDPFHAARLARIESGDSFCGLNEVARAFRSGASLADNFLHSLGGRSILGSLGGA
jgi:hypothetical protein